MRRAIYPGSFDPMTNGHLDIIERALKTFDSVVVAVLENTQKVSTFTLSERLSLVKECIGGENRVQVETFSGLLVDYARSKKINTLLRGLRAVSDFEFEFQLANMNRKLSPDIETVFMMTGEASFFVSSRLVREVASFGGDVSSMVPPPVFTALKAHYSAVKT